MKLEKMKPGTRLYYKNSGKVKEVVVTEVNYRDGTVLASWGGAEVKRYDRWQIEKLSNKA